VLQFWQGFCQWKGNDVRDGLGVVVTINCPSKLARHGIAKAIHDRYENIPNFGTLASTQIQCGFLVEEHGLFRNISINGYEIRSTAMLQQSTIEQFSAQDFEKLELSESGFQIIVDVNTKPMAQRGLHISNETGAIVVQNLRSFIFSDGQQFFVWPTA